MREEEKVIGKIIELISYNNIIRYLITKRYDLMDSLCRGSVV
jgi:hypothetical protein